MSYKDEYADSIQSLFFDLENRIMADVVRRIRKTGEITSTADWQISRLHELLGFSSEEIEASIKATLNASYPEMFELYDKVVENEYTRNKDLYEQINGQFVPYEENGQLQQWIEAAKAQTQNELMNITGTIGFVDNVNGQMTFLNLTDFYRRTMDATLLDITSGAFDYNSTLKRTVRAMTNSGVRTIDYESGYTSRITVAARRAVMTGVSQMSGRISDMNAEKLGAEHFEVAWHSGARPTHAAWQGKVWTKEQLVTVCGLGTVTGLLGANCYHEYYPFFPGISERNWSDEWLEEQNQKESIKKPFKGKEYNTYEATQKQRSMETAMRAQRAKIRYLEDGKADPDEIIIQKAKYQGQLQEYTEFSHFMGLKQQRERIYIDGLGNVINGRRSSINMLSGGNTVKTVAYLIKDIDSQNPNTNLRKMVEDTIGAMPSRVVTAMSSTVIEIGVAGASQYDYIKDKMYIAQNATKTEIIHEIGHLVDNKLLDEDAVLPIKKKYLQGTSMFGLKKVTYHDADNNPKDIFVVNTDKLVSEYQGRVYVEDITDAFDEDLNLRYNKLKEFVSEAFREYIENPEKLEEKHLDMYNMIHEVVSNEKAK